MKHLSCLWSQHPFTGNVEREEQVEGDRKGKGHSQSGGCSTAMTRFQQAGDTKHKVGCSRLKQTSEASRPNVLRELETLI